MSAEPLLPRKCTRCGEIKPFDKYPKFIARGHEYRRGICSTCVSRRRIKNRLLDTERNTKYLIEDRARRRKWRDKNRERFRESARAQKLDIKLRCFDGYGGRVCVCCKDADFNVLTIDHINNDGNKDRATYHRVSTMLYYRLVRNKFPSGYQVLCQSCNWAKHRNGGVLPPSRFRSKYSDS